MNHFLAKEQAFHEVMGREYPYDGPALPVNAIKADCRPVTHSSEEQATGERS